MEMRRRVKEQLKKMGGLEYWDVAFSYIDLETSAETFVGLPESGGGLLITGQPCPPGPSTPSAAIRSDPAARKLALFLIQTQMNPGSGRVIPLGNLSHEDEGGDQDGRRVPARTPQGPRHRPGPARQYDFTVQAINLNQAKEGSETAVAFFISLVSAILERPVEPTTVVLGEMSVQGCCRRWRTCPSACSCRVTPAHERVLIPSENKRDLADVPDSVLDRLQAAFYSDPLNAAIRAMTLE